MAHKNNGSVGENGTGGIVGPVGLEHGARGGQPAWVEAVAFAIVVVGGRLKDGFTGELLRLDERQHAVAKSAKAVSLAGCFGVAGLNAGGEKTEGSNGAQY